VPTSVPPWSLPLPSSQLYSIWHRFWPWQRSACD
jgi:hypothetical protein